MADEANKQEYEVVHPIRVEDNKLVQPATEEDEVNTVSLSDEDAQAALQTGAIKPLRKQQSAESASGEGETGEQGVADDPSVVPNTEGQDAPEEPVEPDPPVAGHDHTAPEGMSEVDPRNPAETADPATTTDTPETSVEDTDTAPTPAAAGEDGGETLQSVYGDDLAAHLENGGYAEPDQVRQASDQELLKLDGIGKKALADIRSKG